MPVHPHSIKLLYQPAEDQSLCLDTSVPCVFVERMKVLISITIYKWNCALP